MHTARLRSTFVAFSVAIAAALVFLAPASANSIKPYSIVICGGAQTTCSSASPAVIAPGATLAHQASLSVTFVNHNKPGSGIQLGSDNLTVPAAPTGFSVVSTSLPACPASLNGQGTTACAILLNGGTTVGFRNLNLGPGQSISITMSALTPPPSTTACTTTFPCAWTDEAKQSNQFNGTGNDLTPDASSSYGTVTAAVASCLADMPCTTTLANGGTASGTPGSVSVTVNTTSGGTAGTQIEALDFGTPLDSSLCSGITALHQEYWDLSADSDRTQTVSITTTPYPGYQPFVCYFTPDRSFTALVLTNGKPSGVAPATPTTEDGVAGWQGLLPECAKVQPPPPLAVDCTSNPGFLSRGVVNPDGTLTTVIVIPPGFDFGHSYQ